MSIFTFAKSIERGSYFVTGRYYIRSDTVISNEVRFEVRPPTGEEKKAYRLLEEAYHFHVQLKVDSMDQKLHQIIASYPKSVYAENACKELVLREMLIQKFPNSGYTLSALRAIANRKSEQERKEFLQKIVEEHPETRSAKFAEQMLRLRY